MIKFHMILAVDEKLGLWKDNTLSWKIPADMKHFKEITSTTQDLAKHNAVIMWRKTWESIPSKYRPLPDRINCVLSRSITDQSIDSKVDDFVLYFNSLESCLEELEKKDNIENIYIIGWAFLYNQLLSDDRLDHIYITRVFWDHDCDVFFDGIPDNFSLESYSDEQESNWIKFRFEVWKR